MFALHKNCDYADAHVLVSVHENKKANGSSGSNMLQTSLDMSFLVATNWFTLGSYRMPTYARKHEVRFTLNSSKQIDSPSKLDQRQDHQTEHRNCQVPKNPL